LLLALGRTNDGRPLLVVGLEEENIRRLVGDQPIYKDLRQLEHDPAAADVKLFECDLTILGPEDMARFVAHFGDRDVPQPPAAPEQ
jgi:hypothetical protein